MKCMERLLPREQAECEVRESEDALTLLSRELCAQSERENQRVSMRIDLEVVSSSDLTIDLLLTSLLTSLLT